MYQLLNLARLHALTKVSMQMITSALAKIPVAEVSAMHGESVRDGCSSESRSGGGASMPYSTTATAAEPIDEVRRLL